MDREKARQMLRSSSPHERLKAARLFARSPLEADLPELRKAKRRETVSWVKKALDSAITGCKKTVAPKIKPDDAPEISSDVRREIRQTVLEEVAGTLIHEIAPVVGLLRADAADELPEFENSKTKAHLEHLTNLLDGLRHLRQAAAAPRLEEFDIASLIKSIVETEGASAAAPDIAIHGPKPMLVMGDPKLLTLAISNGLRNAIDAVDAEGAPTVAANDPIVISWGVTDIDYWVVVIDKGPGLSLSSESAFKIGNSTKKGHSGMGLTIAQEAVLSMEGQIALLNLSSGGAKFEIRWYK